MPKPRPLTPAEAKRTLAHRFAGLADRTRQLATKFGLRSKRVFLVWTEWSGSERGEGEERERARHELLPTPLVSDLTSVALNPYAAGKLPVGSVRVSEISATLTFDQLSGTRVPGREGAGELPPNVDFFYEIVEDGRGDPEPVRQRFRRLAGPTRDEDNVAWSIVLERSSEDRDRHGRSNAGPDAEPE